MTSTPISRRSHAGFWSNAKSFFLPVGQHIDADAVVGYPIDMRIKAASPSGPPAGFWGPNALHVAVTQYALGCHERWLHGDGDEWLHASLRTAKRLIELQAPDGSWFHHQPYPHTFPVSAPWASGITQGQAASLLVRLHRQTGDAELATAAELALAPLTTPQARGGLMGELGGLPWPEEYPTSPQSHVLNGAIFALWGFRDVAVGLGSADAKQNFDDGVQSLARNLHRYDTGSWSLYALFPHPILNRASSFYHDLHVNQLIAMQYLAPRQEFEATRARWEAYATSRYSRATSFAWKAAFRLIVPRNARAARAMPWSHLRQAARA